tara:strand:+ start:201 stop:1070 length:870 start_codon:yes stop_codon:yes gene_type:complete
MKKNLKLLSYLLLSLNLWGVYFGQKAANAFFPIINEPNQEELESTSIQIGKTALQLIQFGQNDEAIKLLKLAVKLNPLEDALWLSLAEAQIRSNQKKEGILSLNKAIELQPKKEAIYFTKASVHMNLKNPKKAIEIIKKGLSINENSERGYFLLGNARIILKEYKLALIAFEKASKINSNFWQSINNQGLILYELNKPKQAISRFKLALKISKDAEPMLALAVVQFTTNNKSVESINLAKNALKTNPKYVSTEYQGEQLWGQKLQKAAQILFKSKEMVKAVTEAKKKSQ